MQKIALVAVALASVMTSSTANAATRIFTISNGMFSDGTSFGGSFGYDDVSKTYSSANINTNTGILAAFNYNYVYGKDIFGSQSVIFTDTNDGTTAKYLNLQFVTSLDGATGAVSLATTTRFGIGSYECNNCTIGRFVTNGSVAAAIAAVPEPASWLMMLVGFGLIGATTRYRRRATKVAYA